MPKLAFLSYPADGHVNPTLPIVQELVKAGIEVVYAVGSDYAERVKAAGATFRGYELPQSEAAIGELFPQLMKIVDEEKPDAIVCDALFPPSLIMSTATKLPAATWRVSFAANENFNMATESHKLPHVPEPPASEVFIRMIIELAQLRQRFGLDADPASMMATMFALTEEVNLVFVTREFHPAGDTFDASYALVGPCLAPRLPQPEFPIDKLVPGKTLLISLGTIFNDNVDFYRSCFEAFADYDGPVVLSCGKKVDLEALGKPPANFIVARTVPQLEVLQRARTFVTHCGMGSTQESLYYGVPMVAIPQLLEQVVTANRVAELGLGVKIDADKVTVAALRESVARVEKDPSFLARVKEMQKATRAAGGAKQAAQVLADFVRSKAKRSS